MTKRKERVEKEIKIDKKTEHERKGRERMGKKEQERIG